MKVTTKKTTMTAFFSMLTVTVASFILIAAPGAYAETTVSLPVGSAIPGCQDTNECYIPAQVTVGVGEIVTWSNDDTAAHTVTSGTAGAVLTDYLIPVCLQQAQHFLTHLSKKAHLTTFAWSIHGW